MSQLDETRGQNPSEAVSQALGGEIERWVEAAVERRLEQMAAARRRRGLRAGAGVGVVLALLGAVVAIAANPPAAGEVVPRQIPYRGVLELNGVPVTNNSTQMLFEIYDAPQNGNLLWSDTAIVAVQDGRFMAALGDDAARPIPAAVFAQPSLHLQVTVDGQLLAGRQRLLSVPYAQFSGGSAATPVGSIVAWLSSSIPAGWHACDGSVIPNDPAHQRLRGLIGNNYPDLRGVFLRGADSGRGVDPGRSMGSWQGWSTGMPSNRFTADNTSTSHNHSLMDGYYGEWHCQGRNDGLLGAHAEHDWDNSVCERLITTQATTVVHGHSVSGGDGETRPANVSVMWIVKDVD